MIISNQKFASISELRDNTSSVIKDVNRIGEKIILSQNKPIGVFLSVAQYNAMKKNSFHKIEATTDDINAYKESSHGKDGVEAFSFLEGLK